MNQFAEWLAPILSTLITTGGLAIINAKLAVGEAKRDEARAEAKEKRKADAEWRESMDKRMDDQDEKIMSILESQCTQMRSDILHKIHRYMDDLGCASIEEKDALRAEHKDYEKICKMYGIENEFINGLVQQVMSLPTRDNKEDAHGTGKEH